MPTSPKKPPALVTEVKHLCQFSAISCISCYPSVGMEHMIYETAGSVNPEEESGY